ncbi:DUF3152 domain-containing protein [Streptomyces sp. NPDC059256]|uniref:DUF3152 domain-containing protein n=1 Tax=Streptomyces sp. NPDC059256 TaxID=3346794 RepID=UPI0036C785D3
MGEAQAAMRPAPSAPNGQRTPPPQANAGGRRRSTPPTGPEHLPAGYAPQQARGGHPEQHEGGGGWGVPRTQQMPQGGPAGPAGRGAGGRSVGGPRQQPSPAGVPGLQGAMAQGTRVPGPRREFVEAFDGARQPAGADPYASVTTWPESPDTADVVDGVDVTNGADEMGNDRGAAEPPSDGRSPRPSPEPPKPSKGRTVTGIAAAAVTTVLAIVVAGQVAEETNKKPGTATTGDERGSVGPASRSEGRKTPAGGAPAREVKPAAPSYEQLMASPFPIDPKLTADGTFEAVPGFEKAPGKGRKIRYRVDIEQGLGMDGLLFATAVQKTLNDKRSWAHGGLRSFERISSGEPDFVITLASPGTTDVWCEKSGLDTSIDNVSCDSAATDRVMVNAFRWAQGSDTYGPRALHAYRQMLINHEVGHRLGHDHVNCSTEGALAPVMQQQTKSLNIKGIACRPNPWVHPGG